MIGTREHVHQMVDTLTEAQLEAAARYLEPIRNDDDPVMRALLNAPLDDEPWTEEDQVALDKAREDVAAGRIVSHEEVRRLL